MSTNVDIFILPAPSQQPTHPVYNISPDKVVQAVLYFLQKPIPNLEPEPEPEQEVPAD